MGKSTGSIARTMTAMGMDQTHPLIETLMRQDQDDAAGAGPPGPPGPSSAPITFRPGLPPTPAETTTYDTWPAFAAAVAARNLENTPTELIVDSSNAPAIATSTLDIDGWLLRAASTDVDNPTVLQVASGAQLQHPTALRGPMTVRFLRNLASISGFAWPAIPGGALTVLEQLVTLEAKGTTVGVDLVPGQTNVITLSGGSVLAKQPGDFAVFNVPNVVGSKLIGYLAARSRIDDEAVFAAGPGAEAEINFDSTSYYPTLTTFSPGDYVQTYAAGGVAILNDSSVAPVFSNVASIQAAVDLAKNRSMQQLWECCKRARQLVLETGQSPAVLFPSPDPLDNTTFGLGFVVTTTPDVVQPFELVGVRALCENPTGAPVTVRLGIWDVNSVLLASVDIVVPALSAMAEYEGFFAVALAVDPALLGKQLFASVWQTDGLAYVASTEDRTNPCGPVSPGTDTFRGSQVSPNITYFGWKKGPTGAGDFAPTSPSDLFIPVDPIFTYQAVGAGP